MCDQFTRKSPGKEGQEVVQSAHARRCMWRWRSFSEDDTRIRVNQGHSVEIELGHAPAMPPELLYHGTATRFLAPIYKQGLLESARHNVHLSADVETAWRVGQRRGQPAALTVKTALMHQAGYAFYLSANGVWLTEHVPPAHLAPGLANV
ncbi:MAG: RNA 2'-phosphotransferase [Acidobacteria bacterium]|nr:RNA 2'-phosphotransferase [Acidobacteriota bacterium]MBI3423280.1 RNA 2'-phosphotransferase [Acidobacteriota bacterium]